MSDIQQPQDMMPSQQPEVQSQQPTAPDNGVQVYDISGKEAVLGTMPADQVEAAVASGKFSLPKGQAQVFNPEGELGSVDAADLHKAVQAGYKYATPDMLHQHERKQTYDTPAQQAIAGLEGFGQGVLGPLAPMAERALGVSPEAIKAREEFHPTTHTIGELAGFGAGMLTGTGEAALLEKAGVGAAKLVGEGRIAQMAAKMATEMAVMQAGDEVTKYVLDAPVSVGNSLADIGLSGLIGGVTGGALGGTALLASKAIEKTGLSTGFQEFKGKLSSLMRGENPAEALHKEVDDALSTFANANDEIWGAQGLKAQALQKAMPEMSEKIVGQSNELLAKSVESLDKMAKEGVPDRYLNKLRANIDEFKTRISQPNASSSEYFDAAQDFKKTLQNYSKGKWGEEVLPAYHEAYDFVNATKSLGREVRVALEDSKVWGEVATTQKELNKAFSEVMPAIKDMKNKFTSKIGGETAVDLTKIEGYLNQVNKSGSKTLRQEMAENFVNKFDKYQEAIDRIYSKAGIENPHTPIGMAALKESLQKPSPYAKAAELFYKKGMAQAGAEGTGGLMGASLGHMTGIPGAGWAGAVIGGKVAEHVLPGILQPLMEKALNTAAYDKALSAATDAIKGQNMIVNGTKALFKAGAMTSAKYLLPDHPELKKLDKQVTQLSKNPGILMEHEHQAGYYLPGTAQESAKITATAVQYLNSLKPQPVKNSPLDSAKEPSQAQMAAYHRQLAIAEKPLVILSHIKNGTLQPQDIQTLKTISPSLYESMAQNITNELANSIDKGVTIPYTMRQSLSLFLGQPLDSTLTPQSIQNAQMTYKLAQQPPQGGKPITKNHNNTSSLGKQNTSYMTPTQSSEYHRMQRG